jgi:hypothetical protein
VSVHVFRVPALIVTAITEISRELLEVPMGKRPFKSPDEERKGGGYLQREGREAKAAKVELVQSETGQHLVLKPSPLGTPPPL